MKKFIILGIIILIIATIPMTAFATDNDAADLNNYDSIKLSDEVRQKFVDNSDYIKVIKLYSIPLLPDAFTRYHSFDELVASKNYSEYYAIVELYTPATKFRKIDANGEVVDVDLSPYNTYNISSTDIKRLFDNSFLTKVSSDIEVYNTYYLYTFVPQKNGTAIYYKTNKGDLVYYSFYKFSGGLGEYLFPIHKFCEYQNAILEDCIKNPFPTISHDNAVASVWDMSKYDINSDSFAPLSDSESEGSKQEASNISIYLWVGIPCVAVLVIAGVAFGVIFGAKKMRKNKKGETQHFTEDA